MRIDLVRHDATLYELLLGGELTLAATGPLRTAVRKCAAEGPAHVVLNLDGLTHVERFCLLILPALQRRCATLRPPITLLVRADPASLGARALAEQLPGAVSFADVAGAARYAYQLEPPSPSARLLLPRAAATPDQAQSYARRLCRTWLVPWLANEAGLAARELVANAIAHAAPEWLSLGLQREHLRIMVRDDSREIPRTRLGGVPAVDHGLGIVELVADRWGTFLDGQGKTVWADLPVAP